MADPMSIGGTVVGIISLGIQAAQYLVDYYGAVKDQQTDILHIAQRLESLLHVLEFLKDGISNRKFDKNEAKLLAKFKSSIEQCEGCIDELQKEVEKFKKEPANLSLPSSPSKFRYIGYQFRKAIRAASYLTRRVAYPLQQGTLEKLDKHIADILPQLSILEQTLQARDLGATRLHSENAIKLLSLFRADQVSLKFRGWLNAPDATINFNEACSKRHHDTGMWFVEDPMFSSWLTEPNSLLWLNGFAGTGKSVLCSTAIQYAHQYGRSGQRRTGTAFFFFTFSDNSKQDASGLLRALVLQLSSQLGDQTALEELNRSYQNATSPIHALMECLHRIVQSFDDVHIIIDALDESPRNKNREATLGTLVDLHRWAEPGLHLLVTSRDEVDIRDEIVELTDQIITMKNDCIKEDIRSFVSEHLRKDKRFRKWKNHHGRIQAELTERAKGNFRWVDCQLQALASCPASEDLFEKLLNSLPKTLDETYKRMLLNIEPNTKDYAQRMLTLLCCAKRPLTVLELIDGMAVDFGDNPSFDPRRRLEDPKSIQEVCPGFLQVTLDLKYDETIEHVVHIVHFSVQEYIQSSRIRGDVDVNSFAVDPQQANTQIASVCLSFLTEPSLATSPNEYRFVHYAGGYWLHHLKDGEQNEHIEAQIWRLFRDRYLYKTWCRYMEYRNDLVLEPEALAQSPLCCASAFGLHSTVKALLDEIKTNEAPFFDWGELKTCNNVYEDALIAAAANRRVKIVQLLFRAGGIHLRELGKAAALSHASASGEEKIVEFLLDQGVDPNTDPSANPRTPLSITHAAKYGHDRTVELLLDRNADVNKPDRRGNTPLTYACGKGKEKVVRLLLDNNAEINVQNASETPLGDACEGGHERIVRLLLEGNADINLQNSIRATPLWTASAKGRENIVRLLLDRNADTHPRGGKYDRSALHMASWKGHDKVVQMLLDAKADINEVDQYGFTALHIASQECEEKVVQVLLDNNADINAVTNIGRTALYYSRNKRISQMLRDSGLNHEHATEKSSLYEYIEYDT